MTDRAQQQAIVDLIISYEADLEFTSALHPTNAAEQKRLFLAKEQDNPTFTYEKVTAPEVLFTELSASVPLADLYQERMQHTSILSQLLHAVGDDAQFTNLSNQAFPVKKIQEVAVEYIQQLPQENKTTLLSADQIKKKFEKALADLSLHDWKVDIETGISSRMYVNQWDHHIGIRADVQVTEREAERLTKHEIGVHVLRAANGFKQTEPLLQVGTHKGRLFEEGVACYIEDPKGPWRIFLRHYAVQLAQKSSFREVWQGLIDKNVPPDTAWAMTLRVKRGIADTSQPGAFTRDAMYAQAFTEMKAYMDAGGDIMPLLSAPIHPSEIERLKTEGNLAVFNV